MDGNDDSSEGVGHGDEANFEVSEFFEFEDWIDEDPIPVIAGHPQNPNFALNEAVYTSGGSSHREGSSRGGGSTREITERRQRYAFRTMSQVEILDDGYKWRKYGKKMVKNSPNPRNYYRCSVEGCPVKKRVERDKDDPRYVITTYENNHNHPRPSQI